MWMPVVILILSSLITTASSKISMETGNSTVKTHRSVGGVKGRETCTIPCDIVAKLLQDEKHSLCGHLQQALLAYGRSTRKLIRDVMDDQQRALDFLTSQVTELMNKLQTLSSEVHRSNNDMYTSKPDQSHGRDCSDIRDTLLSVVPKIPSGIYIITPDPSDSAFEVFCEMDYMGGGWTVIQRRTDGLMDFRRPWANYVDGFGHLPGEHWLGLSKVFSIVRQNETRFQLHVSLESQDESSSYASYDDFTLDPETLFYSIHLGRYAGSAGDGFRGYDQDQNQDTAPFSASDVDNDGCLPFCTFDERPVESCSHIHNKTGWWFNQCGLANLNGSPEDREKNNSSLQNRHIRWDTWTQSGIPHSIKSVTMKIRRMPTNN